MCLTHYLAQETLELTPQLRSGAQEFVCNIGEAAHSVTADGEKLLRPQLWTNADQADLRVWLHYIHSTGMRKLIFFTRYGCVQC